MALQLLNLELSDDRALGGRRQDDIATAEWSQPLVSGAILRDDRARIVMPMWLAPGSQCVAPLAAAAKPLVLTLPGVPESSSIFELNRGRLEPLRHLREPGGTQVTIEDFGLSRLLFLAEDPTIIGAMSRRAAAAGPTVHRVGSYLAAQKLDDGRPRPRGRSAAEFHPRTAGQYSRGQGSRSTARQNLQLCDARLRSGDYAVASSYARGQ